MSWSPFSSAAPAVDEKFLVSSPASDKTVSFRARERKSVPRRHLNRPTSVVPMVKSSIMVKNHRFRFNANGSLANVGITVAGVFGALGVVATSATAVAGFVSSFKIRKITIYDSSTGTNDPPVELLWSSSTTVNTEDVAYTTATIPYDRPATIVATPPKGSLSGFWWNTSATALTPLFNLTIGSGCYLDLDVDFTLANGLLGLTYSVATATLASVYYLYLDGNTSHKLQPIGLPNTF
jgi:hypothetical protein